MERTLEQSLKAGAGCLYTQSREDNRIKKAVINDIKRFAVHDGDGIRTTVFFKGCPLKCLWCHTPEGIKVKPEIAYYEHKCIDCGECAYVCPTRAHIVKCGKHDFDRKACIACGRCTESCFGGALTFYGKSAKGDWRTCAEKE